MDIKDEWNALRTEWLDEYEKYQKQAEQIVVDIENIKKQIDANITQSNKIRSDFETDGLIDKLTQALQWFNPNFKNESIQDFTIEFQRAVPQFDLICSDSDMMCKMPKLGKKKKLEECRTKFAAQKNDFQNNLQERADEYHCFQAVQRITRMYFELLNQLHATIRHSILPELHWVHTFLYADAIARVIRDGQDPQTVVLKPRKIKEFAQGRYSTHYVFVNNTFILQRLMADFYHKGNVTKLIWQKKISDADLNGFEQKVKEIYKRLDGIKSTAVM